jgi:response regulator RpfG family c-di-GMP phosphodiesterase
MTQKPKLLIVDDNRGFSESIRLILRDEYEIQTVYDGFEALERTRSNMFDLILLDLRLPGMSGLETLRRIKVISPSSEVVIITAYGEVKTIKDAIRLGAVDYLEKTGFPALQIKEALRRAMRQRRARIEREERLNELRQQNRELSDSLSIIQTEINRQRDLEYDRVVEAISIALDIRQDIATVHARSVEEYMFPIVRKLGLSHEEEIALRVAAALHDVGMLAVSETILAKPGPLSEEEWRSIERHPSVGANIIEGIGKWPAAIQLVLYHHERMDGSGYPHHLKGDQIPFLARIIAVADVYDAMISDRPYRKALSKDEAIEELMKDETKFDPEVVRLFCESL